MRNTNIIDIDDLRKQKALEAYNNLSPEFKRYVKLVKKDFQDSHQIPWHEIPADLHEIVRFVAEKDMNLA